MAQRAGAAAIGLTGFTIGLAIGLGIGSPRRSPGRRLVGSPQGGPSSAYSVALAVGVALVAVAGVARAASIEELVQLPSAGDAKLPVLIGWDEARAPDVAAVLFNGGGGAVGLLRRIPRPGANFLVRTRSLFQREGVATAVIDVPTDWAAMSDAQLVRRRHAAALRFASSR